MKIENIRHSLSHLLAMAVLKKFPQAQLGIGPVIENGFYYDFWMHDDEKKITEEDLPEIEEEMRKLIKQNIEFKKFEADGRKIDKIYNHKSKVSNLNKDEQEVLEYFKSPKGQFKNELLKELIKQGEKVIIYKSGNFIDLCAGPHVKNSSEINADAFKLTKIAGAYWRGNEKNPQLQRIYGVAFETEKELNEYLKMLETAKHCDHRTLGERLEYFMIDEQIGKGLPLLLPKGYDIRRQLENYMYEVEKRNGYLHVLTPILAKEELYKKSGHLAHYKDDMYAPIEIEKEKYYLKPMNCPHHHSIYKHRKRSYRELPLRIAEFGHVHRYERSGVLSGLIRVRGFTQNDAHIYTDEEHLEKEIISVINLAEEVYKTFGIKDYWYRLSLPDFKNKEKFGDIKNKKMWEKSSEFLKKALKNTGHKFVEAAGEATFYGPKIDIQIKDVWGREDSIGTIQVDYYSAPRFNLYYTDKKGEEQPAIIIHRAIMGAFERFFAFLLEKTCGNLPLWLSPVQTEILPVGSRHEKYAKKVCAELIKNNIRAEINDANETIGKKIRNAELEKIPYILVVGDKEEKNNAVAVRTRGKNIISSQKLSVFTKKILKEIESKK